MGKRANTIAIYSRKSKFTGKGESIGNQVELCREYIRLHYGEAEAVNAAVFEDEGFSGGNLNRPDFKKMMESARKRKFQAIIVYRLDRISRNIGDFSGLIEELSRLDIAFVSIREQFDTGSPMGRAMMYIASVFSQLERETIAERIRDNMHELAKTGRWLGGTTPTGYASESVQTLTVDGKTRKACRLKLIPKEAEAVKTIYAVFQETDSLTMTDAELLRRQMTTKMGKKYTRFSIKGILQNPVYMIADEDAWNWFQEQGVEVFSCRADFDGKRGIIAYNRTDQEKGRTTVCNPVREWIVCTGQHQGIIPGKVWVAVQESLERNKSKGFRKAKRNEALLTGLLYCSCGSRMYPKMTKGKTASGKPIFTYVCKMKERSRKASCDAKNLNGNFLDGAIIEQIKQLEEDQSAFLTQLEKSKSFYMGKREDWEAHLDVLRKEKEELAQKIEGLVDALAVVTGSTAKAAVVGRIEKLNEENDALDIRIQELEGRTSQNGLRDSELDVLRKRLSRFGELTDLMTLEQKRSAVRALIGKVVWDGANVHVILLGVSDEEIESPGISGVTQNAAEFDDTEMGFDSEYGDGEENLKTLRGEDSK